MKTTMNMKHINMFFSSIRYFHKKIKRIEKNQEAKYKKSYNLTFKSIFDDISSKKQKNSANNNEMIQKPIGQDMFSIESDIRKQAKYAIDETKRVKERKRKNLITMRFMDEVFYHNQRFTMDLYDADYYGKTNIDSSHKHDYEENIYEEKMELMLSPLKRQVEMDLMKFYEKNDPQKLLDIHRNMSNDQKCGILTENDQCLNYDSEEEIGMLFENLKLKEREDRFIDERNSRLKFEKEISFDDEFNFAYEKNQLKKDLTGTEMPGENEVIDKSFMKTKCNEVRYQRVWRKRINSADDPEHDNEV